MKFLALILILTLNAPAALAAGPVFGHGPLLARAEDGGRRQPGTVVITGREGKVTGVERRGGEHGNQERGQDREPERGHGPGNPPQGPRK